MGLLWAGLLTGIPRASAWDADDWEGLAMVTGLLFPPVLQAVVGTALLVMVKPVPSRRARRAVRVMAGALVGVSLGVPALLMVEEEWLEWELPGFLWPCAQWLVLLLVLGLAVTLLRLRDWKGKWTALLGLASVLAGLLVWFWALEELKSALAGIYAGLNR
jgi:hypothetical protein